jgi:hypothetical protein
MARRWSGSAALLFCGALIGVNGCGQSAAPPKSIATQVTTPSATTGSPRPQAEPGAPSQPPPAPEPAKPALEVSPATVTLAPGDPGAQLIARVAGTHGGTRDVTGKTTWKVQPDGVVAIDADGYVRAIGPGQATIQASFEGVSNTLPATVEPSAGRAWDFGQDIVPILTRAGCNTGGCHGKADGQNGFHLSLFGYDDAGDYQALTRDAAERRISRLDPESSLFLRKATGRVPHVGGLRVMVGSPEYQTLLAWVKAGAPERQGKTHGALTKLEVEPAALRLDEPGPLQVRVVARFADGHARDVTRLASFRVNDDSAVSIDHRGKGALLRRAETDLVVRYQSQVVSTRLATLINPDLKFDYAKLARRNFVDDELFKRLESLKVPPSPRSSDALFFRRVSLDLTGEQPLPEQIREFADDKDPEKRTKLVDKLLASRDFVRFWQIKLGDMLQISNARQGNSWTRYQTWVGQQLASNTPWDVVVKQLLTSVGDPMALEGGPVNYALDDPDPKVQAELTAQRFLGLRVRCAQCHDHPFDVWTQDDYFGLAACFAKVQRAGGGGMMGKTLVKINTEGSVEHLRTKKPAAPRLLSGKAVEVAAKDDPRKPLADWITAPDNPYFARATANWVWAQLFGKGLADPADDLSRSNPPVHPELLDKLAEHFVKQKFNLRDLVRTIATSEAYGLSSEPVPGNERDTRLFSHHLPRPLTAHQMADAIAQATDVPNRFPNRSASTRAIDVTDPNTASPILDTFGRCSRTAGCAATPTPALSLRQSLLLIGGDVIESKVTHLNGYLHNMLELKPEPEEIVENLYLRTLCRPATAEEISRWSAELKQASSLSDAAEDLFWALLNSREFAFNH